MIEIGYLSYVVDLFESIHDLIFVDSCLQVDIVLNSLGQDLHGDEAKSLHSFYDFSEQTCINWLAFKTACLASKSVETVLHAVDGNLLYFVRI